MIAYGEIQLAESLMYLRGARHDLSVALEKLSRMGEGDGWPDSSTKAEIGVVRGVLKRHGLYFDEMDDVREFDLFRCMVGGWTPRHEQEDQVRITKERIEMHRWAEEVEKEGRTQ